MYKITLVFILFAFSVVHAQNKKPAVKVKDPAPADSVAPAVAPADSTDPIEESIKAERRFGVYTRKPRKPDNRMKLCINLVSPASMLNLCINDSVCKYPEKSKILFEKTDGDSTYVLVFVEAFTKVNDKPSCDAGKETKVFFIRWNTKTNKAVYKVRTVSSCIKVITNMTKEPIMDWDGSSPLLLKYHKGGDNFVEVKFDPQNYLLGFQSASE